MTRARLLHVTDPASDKSKRAFVPLGGATPVICHTPPASTILYEDNSKLHRHPVKLKTGPHRPRSLPLRELVCASTGGGIGEEVDC